MTTSRILVVEDDPRLAATLQRLLAAEGHDVEIAGDGHDGLRRARDRPFDLVVLDIMLPGIDGLAVCKRLRAAGPIPILLLTALGGTEERVRGLDSGADDYLVKPFAYEELRRELGLSSAAPHPAIDSASPTCAWSPRVTPPGAATGSST